MASVRGKRIQAGNTSGVNSIYAAMGSPHPSWVKAFHVQPVPTSLEITLHLCLVKERNKHIGFPRENFDRIMSQFVTETCLKLLFYCEEKITQPGQLLEEFIA